MKTGVSRGPGRSPRRDRRRRAPAGPPRRPAPRRRETARSPPDGGRRREEALDVAQVGRRRPQLRRVDGLPAWRHVARHLQDRPMEHPPQVAQGSRVVRVVVVVEERFAEAGGLVPAGGRARTAERGGTAGGWVQGYTSRGQPWSLLSWLARPRQRFLPLSGPLVGLPRAAGSGKGEGGARCLFVGWGPAVSWSVAGSPPARGACGGVNLQAQV